MADSKVSALTAAGSFLAADEIPVNEAGTSKKVTGTQIQTFIRATCPYKADEQTSATGTVTLTVPAGAHNLEIDFVGRSSGVAATLLIQFNGDGGANYDSGGINDVNATLTGQTPTIGGTSGLVGTLPVSTATAGSVAGVRIFIQNADSTTLYKVWEAYGTRNDANTAAGFNQSLYSGQWRNTAAAITSVTLIPGAAVNFVNMRATLYVLP